MKKLAIAFSLVSIVILISCQGKDSYSIKGSFADTIFDGKTIYLQKMDSLNAETTSVVDSAIIKNKAFSFEGVLNGEPTLGIISIGKLPAVEEYTPIGTLILEPGKLEIAFDERGGLSLAGSTGNEKLNKVHLIQNNITKLYQEAQDAGSVEAVPLDSAGQDAVTRMAKLQEEMSSAYFDVVKSNINSEAGKLLFLSDVSKFSIEQIKELYALSDSTFKAHPVMMKIEEQLNRVVPEIGDSFADVSLVDINGEPRLISHFIQGNRCVILYFWAAGNPNVAKEVETLNKLYNAYRDKGLEIIGISIDDDRMVWLNGIESYNMKWVQLADDLGKAVDIYNVLSIPHSILINEKGVIVSKDLKDKDLADKVTEILK
ncbi:TlpA disulfide reductase family protein [Dysgonomonas sp. 511]|uniref:TlpA disulfide reductase family protein n=1 Tax=Dysgonomonas sp. 511 TaxID=2302930 RepID=UPI0013D13C0C|nr:TlpA disulfide reductase family protein [Dysgonomonas sp. 511]NDV77509.1 AhpC/TSA family protein [Dysgonomonas sp. 511]